MSIALAIANRLGLPEDIVNTARGTLNPADLKADDLLDDIHRQRKLGVEALQAAERAREEAEGLRTQLADRLIEVEEERQEILENIRQEARRDVKDLQEELKDIRSQIKREEDPGEKLKELQEKTDQVEEEVSRPDTSRRLEIALPHPMGPIEDGDRVYLRSLGKKGVVLSVDGEHVEVQVGNIRVRAQKADLEHTHDQDLTELETQSLVRTPKETASPGIELDLRGQQVDEAL